MGRIRTVKPEFFKHFELYQAEIDYGLPLRTAYAGLWTTSDREGRFKWRPHELKTDVLPHDKLDFEHVLNALVTRGFVKKYSHAGEVYGVVLKFKIHQVINNKEKASVIPAHDSEGSEIIKDVPEPQRVEVAYLTPLNLSQGERKGKEGKGTRKGKGKEGNDLPTEDAKKAQLFIATYCELFKSAYKTNPEVGGKNAGIVKRLVKNLSPEKIELYLYAYFGMPDARLMKEKHPINLFEYKLNEIVVFANTKQFMTQKQVHQADVTATVQSQLRRIEEGLL